MEYPKKIVREYTKSTIKYRKKNWIEINDESRAIYNTNSQFKFKTTMLKSRFHNYSDAYILVEGCSCK